MSVNREHLTDLKEGFWKEPIKEGSEYLPDSDTKRVEVIKALSKALSGINIAGDNLREFDIYGYGKEGDKIKKILDKVYDLLGESQYELSKIVEEQKTLLGVNDKGLS